MAALRGWEDWSAGTEDDRTTALANALDVIATYDLRSGLDEAAQAKVDLATIIVARDLLVNGHPSARAAQPTRKTEKELAGMKVSIEYFDAVRDTYPQVTALLAPLIVRRGGGAVFNGLVSL